jgi:hypothetical protein
LEHDPTGIAAFFAKRTYFQQYIAGETVDEVAPTVAEIAKLNMKGKQFSGNFKIQRNARLWSGD